MIELIIHDRKRFQRLSKRRDDEKVRFGKDDGSFRDNPHDAGWQIVGEQSEAPEACGGNGNIASNVPGRSHATPRQGHRVRVDDAQGLFNFLSCPAVPERPPDLITDQSPPGPATTDMEVATLLDIIIPSVGSWQPVCSGSNSSPLMPTAVSDPFSTSSLRSMDDQVQDDSERAFIWEIPQGTSMSGATHCPVLPALAGPSYDWAVTRGETDQHLNDLFLSSITPTMQQLFDPLQVQAPPLEFDSALNLMHNTRPFYSTAIHLSELPSLSDPFTAAQSGLSIPTFAIPPVIKHYPDYLSIDVIDSLIRPQLEVYFDRINPMMPVLMREDILGHLDDSTWLDDRDNLALVLVASALALLHPMTAEEKSQRHKRERQAIMLLDQACHLVAAWDYGCRGTVEKTLTSFFMFGILHELGHVEEARMRLRDAITMGDSMELDKRSSYQALSPYEGGRRLRLFYILAMTER